MTGSEINEAITTIDLNSAVNLEHVDLSRVDIGAITAQAAQLRAAESGRLLRQAWLTIGSLWRGPRRVLPATHHHHATGTPS